MGRLPGVGAVGTVAGAARALLASGLVAPERPDRLAGMLLALGRWGLSPAAGYAAAAARSPDRLALVDDRDTFTFADVDRRTDAIAAGLADLGIRPGDVVGILARNSAQFVLGQVAAAKLGADLVYLNTGFAAAQLEDVLRAEQVAAVIADDEFDETVAAAAPGRLLVHAWRSGARRPGGPPSLTDLAEGVHAPPQLPLVRRNGRHVLLTSGTTGRPKGAARSAPPGLSGVEPLVALLSAIPVRAREATVIASPLFHAWGFAHLELGLLLESTLVLTRRFDAERVLTLLRDRRASTLVAVPVMLKRVLDLPAEVRQVLRPPALEVVALSGSALPVELSRRFRAEYGDVLYDLYGSTEVAYASLATPQDMREAPGSVGRPLAGVTVRIVGPDRREVTGTGSGRIFVGNAMTFAGYTGGADKDRLDGLVATGDVGHFDADGRLYVDGRDDDMIVSGGENVFPGEVEECLRTHPAVGDVAVAGVPDEEFGARLVAHVVARSRVDAEELRDHVRRALAGYKVPRAVVFHDVLPRNETGKVVKRELPAPR